MNAFNAHDNERILSLFTDDCMIEELGPGRTLHGKQELRKYNEDSFAAFPDVKLEFKTEFRAGDWAAYEWVMTGTHKGTITASKNMPAIPATNKKFTIRGATINQIRNDKVSQEHNYFDTASFMQQLGLMPSTPQ